MQISSRNVSELLRAGRFAIIGGLATLVHLVFAQVALAIGGISLTGANTFGFVCAFVAGFLGHQYFTFSSTAPFWQAFRRYGVIAIAGFAVNNIVLFGLVNAGLLTKEVSLTIAIVIVPIGTFLASRLWGFKSDNMS